MIDEGKLAIVNEAWLQVMTGGPNNEGYDLGPMEINTFYQNLKHFLKFDPAHHSAWGRALQTRVYKFLKEDRPDLYEPLSEWTKLSEKLNKEYWKAWHADYDAKLASGNIGQGG